MSYLARRFVSATHSISTRQCLLAAQSPTWHAKRCFNSTTILRKKVDFTQKQGEETETAVKEESIAENRNKEKKGKKYGTKTSSLRRVAVEAQRSRQGFVKGRGSKRFIDPHVETKVCTLLLVKFLSLTAYTDSNGLLRCRNLQHLYRRPPRQSPGLRTRPPSNWSLPASHPRPYARSSLGSKRFAGG